MPSSVTIAPIYRYFTVDLLSNALIAEIPFKSVKYERALKSAGSFSGSIPIIDDTSSMDLYESTMPGKTALYVVRDSVCVWGGIIWSRAYDVGQKMLSVNASEFTSYLYHRNIWKTYTHEFEATLVASSGVVQVTIDNGEYEAAALSSVRVFFYEVSDMSHNGYYEVKSSPSPTTNVFYVDMPSLPNGTYVLCTVVIRSDTYDYVRQLIDHTFSDFVSIIFDNTEIEPALAEEYSVTSIIRTSNVATITVDAAHDAIIGQVVQIQDVDSALNGFHEVTAIPDDYSVSFALSGSNIASTAKSAVSRSVTHKQLTTYVATLTTSAAHGFTVGAKVVVTAVDAADANEAVFDGEYQITAVTSTTFSYISSGVTDIALTATSNWSAAETPTATVAPYMYIPTYGPFPNNANIGLELIAENMAPQYPTTTQITDAGLPATLYPTSPTPVVAGNIVLTARPLVANADGSISTLYSESSLIGGYEVIYPRIINGRLWSSADAKAYATTTGQHLGKFASGNTVDAGTYAEALHTLQEQWMDLITYEKSTTTYSGKNVENKTYRGYELLSVGEELDNYSDTVDGFEFRVDCDYDYETGSFTKTLVLMPIDYPNPPDPGEVSLPSRFGADALVFEYPGNISNVKMDESAENAATRFFVVGNIGDLGEDASQPYAAASAKDMLNAGWPILDAEESVDYESEEKLYKYAARYLAEHRPPISDFNVSVNGSLDPVIGTYAPGDWCSIIVDDVFVRQRLASDLEPRDTVIVRKINSFSVSVPDTPTFPEQVELDLISEPEVDKRG